MPTLISLISPKVWLSSFNFPSEKITISVFPSLFMSAARGSKSMPELALLFAIAEFPKYPLPLCLHKLLCKLQLSVHSEDFPKIVASSNPA